MNPRAAHPPQPAGTYTVAQGQLLTQQSSTAGIGDLLIAADYITRLFDANQIPFAFMGGFSVNVRGSQRETHDVDVAVGCDMHKLLMAVSTQPDRLLRPLGPVSGVMRIFIKGENEDGLSSPYVMVDLILRGSLGAPDHLETESEDVKAGPDLGDRPFRLINLPSLLQSKLGAFFGRSADNDMADIIFLILRYPEEVYNARAALNQEHRQHFINKLAVTRDVPKSQMNKARHALGIPGPALLTR
ncbi:hypothetical protein DV735_g3529, partial [Chaetothyriales sp. CBS 134920]